MTKTRLVLELARRADIPRAMAERVVVLFFDSLRTALLEDRRVEIRGFGTFKVRHYDGHTGHNPRTHEAIVVPPKVLPKFKGGKALLERLNGKGAPRRRSR